MYFAVLTRSCLVLSLPLLSLAVSCLFVLCCVGVHVCVCRLLLLSCPVLCRAVCFVLFCLVLFWSSSGSFGVILNCLGGRFGSVLVFLGVVLALLGRLGGLLGHLGAVLGAVDDG